MGWNKLYLSLEEIWARLVGRVSEDVVALKIKNKLPLYAVEKMVQSGTHKADWLQVSLSNNSNYPFFVT